MSVVARPASKRALEPSAWLWALAAAIVLLGNFATLPFAVVPGHLEVLAQTGWIGVASAFALAGFLAARAFADTEMSRATVAQFWVRHLFAIAPLFMVMLGLWVFYGIRHGASFAPQTLALNLTMAFNPVLGVQDSLVAGGWAVGVLIVFYVIAPPLGLLLTDIRSAFVGFVVSVLLSSAFFDALQPTSAVSASYASSLFLTWLPFFVAGILAFHVARHVDLSRPHTASALLLSAMVVAAIALTPPFQELFVGLRVVERLVWCVAAVLLILASLAAQRRSPLWIKPQYVRGLSYGAYLIHPLVLQIFRVDMWPSVAQLGLSPTKSYAVAAGLMVPAVLALSGLALVFVQLPAFRVGELLSARLSASPRTGSVGAGSRSRA
jgi:peptidoglycan/LPS O-acetylase OafA/YrhL